MKIRSALALAVTSLLATATVSVFAPGASAIPPIPALPPFYTVPSPLTPSDPGAIISYGEVEVPGLNGTMWRVMYHSQSIDGADIAVTGLIAVPDDGAESHDVITWAHGTTGIADTCAPSLDPADASNVALTNTLLDRGYVVTATDYEGLGTPGRHPYIAGVSEGRGTIDIVRAAASLPVFRASSRYIIWGHSQGGHAAMFAGHIAADWAPELELKGVVAGAPPSQMLLLNAALQRSPFKYYIAMAAAGLNAAYGDTRAPLDKVLTPEGLDWLNNVDEGCTGYLNDAAEGVDFTELQKADPADVPEWNLLLEENDPGNFTEPFDAPLLIIHGGNDEQIPVIASKLMYDSLCGVGQTQTRWVFPGQSHAGVIVPSAPAMLDWMAARFAGLPDTGEIVPAEAQVESCNLATPVVAPSFTG
jgi:alpha-beta hydrolase superfamily lysophospholipase